MRFKEKNSYFVCRDLLGNDLTVPEDKVFIKEKNLFRTVCPEMVKSAVLILEEVLNEYK